MASIYNIFNRSVEEYPNNICLVKGDVKLTYHEVERLTDGLYKLINQVRSGDLVGVLSSKSIVAYTSILAVLRSGRGYVPINPKFPIAKNKAIIESSGIETIIVDSESLDLVKELFGDGDFNIIFPNNTKNDVEVLKLAAHLNSYTNEDIESLNKADAVTTTLATDVAYLLFTSGSTGVPKGVPVLHKNVLSYLDSIFQIYDFKPSDRFSQVFDFTFDLSVHDMFVCFKAGGSLCIPPEYISPISYIRGHELTVWFSVPSLIHLMKKSRALKENYFPSLRWSLFCGEPLPLNLAIAWQKSASNSFVENIYGPTEATIGISNHRLSASETPKSHLNFVSIGKIFSSQAYCILDEDGNEAKFGEPGELYLAGDQIVDGYWRSPTLTSQKFVILPEKGGMVWYNTGDIVMKDHDGDLFYISRKDFQVKIRGYRVELEEINSVIRSFLNTDLVISIPYSEEDSLNEGIHSFVEGVDSELHNDIIEECQRRLVSFMVPEKIHFLKQFPLNSNGKIDRNQLLHLILVERSTIP